MLYFDVAFENSLSFAEYYVLLYANFSLYLRASASLNLGSMLSLELVSRSIPGVSKTF